MNPNATSTTIKTLPAHRRRSLTAGILYLLTFVSIPSLALYSPVKSTGYILGAGTDTSAIIAAILEVIVALAGIGTAVALFPILKRQNESVALALFASRILESACIFGGVVFIMTIVTLRQSGSGTDLTTISHTLVALYDRMFLQSQSFMPAICDILLGTLLYKSRLVPRALSLIGIIGGPILLLGYLAVMFGLVRQHAALAGLSAAPVAVFEFSLGLYLVIKGFKPEAITALEARHDIVIA